MFHSSLPSQKERAIQRLKAFDLYEDVDPDFQIALPILSRRARDVALAYTDHYMRMIKAFPDEEKREAFVDRVTAGFKSRYDTPVGLDWVNKGEDVAHNIHGRGADLADHLSALSVAQVKEIMLVFEGVDDPSDGIRIAAKMCRLQALDAEILLSTVKELQAKRHFDWVQNEVKRLHSSMAKMVEDTARQSQASEAETHFAGKATGELEALSATVSKASQATADAMVHAASEAGQLREALDQAVLELSRASEALREAISVGDKAVATVDALSTKSSSIETIAALIEEITDRSDVLSLNASIEAARAGEAGVGFAVVANEMKALSKQTASATLEIFSHVAAIRTAREEALEANRSMLSTFGNVSEMTELVKSGVSAKSSAVSQIAERADQTARHAAQSRETIDAMNALASGVSQTVAKAGSSLHDLTAQVEAMRRGTDELLTDLELRAHSDAVGAHKVKDD